MPRRARILWLGALTLIFCFRLAYGLTSTFWTEDERQVYIIGLRSFARGDWPFFGADIVWTNGQLPGALQAMFVRWPLEIWPIPEAPFILLNLLSFGTLGLLAWYIRRRVPEVPAWLVWGALLTLPWTLNFSTHIVNTSYILPGAIVFFVGFFEAAPMFRLGLLPGVLAWLMMGAALLFLAQIHMSWVLLPPYVALAAAALGRRDLGALGRMAAAFVMGAALTGSLLVPTLLEYGWTAGGVNRAVQYQPQGPAMLLTILARFLSFPSFETNRFLGLDVAERLMFLWRQPWVLPFTLFATIVGFVQPVAMAAAWFKRSDRDRGWMRMRWLTAGTVLWIYGSFFFSVRGPLAHTFYVVFPVGAVYAAYCWRAFVGAPDAGQGDRPPRVWLRRVAAATLVSGVIMHAGLAIDRAPRRSLYRNRALVQAAIRTPNDRFLGERRDSLIETQDRRARPIDPVPDPEAYNGAAATKDLVVLQQEWMPLLAGRVSRFVVSIRNASTAAAYLDVRYSVQYFSATGTLLTTREGVIKEILQPGDVHTWHELTNGMVPESATAATLSLVSAEKAVPAGAHTAGATSPPA